MSQSNKWIVDKHIPLAFILAVIVQTGGAFWWASAMEAAVKRNAEDISTNRALSEKNSKMNDVLIELELYNKYNEGQFREIKNRLNKIEDKAR